LITYKDAGVDVERGYEAVRRMKRHAQSTFDGNVMTGLGSFGGCYSIKDFIKGGKPVLVSGTDGVGTKLKIAFLMGKHDTVGIDCVSMCADDVVCQGAKPLFFLDYIATGKIEPGVVADIVAGVAEGCRQAGCALIGGETAEMPGFYAEGEYDLAGFTTGIVDEAEVITGAEIRKGDALIGLASSGLHSNGYSLVRKLLLEDEKSLGVHVAELGRTLGEELLAPTRIYAKNLLALMDKVKLRGIAHITGGGFIENIPRMFPEGLGCTVRKGTWHVHPIFDILAKRGGLDDAALYNTWNMGIGMVLAVRPEDAAACVREANALGEMATVIGEVTARPGVVIA
jgi:phosphoribosylformylglycinamidine cyclo-ligase